MTERLSAFSALQVDVVRRKLGTTKPPEWPHLDGVLAVLFTSRSGSTFLARELEPLFAIGQMRESLNPPRVAGRSADKILAGREGDWFSFKAGGTGVIAAELCGFFDAYMARAVFIRLLRRDIVAQAVSLQKAHQTAQFHSTQSRRGEAAYNARAIARSVKLIVGSVERLAAWVGRADRPCQTLIYEDFAQGDFAPAMLACAALGAPRRPGDRAAPYLPVDKIGDASNLEWAERFAADMDGPTRECVERYRAAIPAPVGGEGALGATGERKRLIADAAFSVRPVRRIDRTGAANIWSRSKDPRAPPTHGRGSWAGTGGKAGAPSTVGRRVFEWKKELREINARLQDARLLLVSRLEEGRATMAAIWADNESLADMRGAEAPKQSLATGPAEEPAARSVVQADNQTRRALRLAREERQESLQILRDAMAAARQECEVLKIRREELKTLLNMPPAPDDGSP